MKNYILVKLGVINMCCIRKISCQLGCLLLVCFALINQACAAEEIKFSKNDVEKFVLQARDYALAQGNDKALNDFMDPDNKQFRQGPLYIFAFDYQGICLANIKAAMVGTNMQGLRDQNEVMIIKSITDATLKDAKGGWAEYMWQNPVTKKIEKKYSFSVKVDDNWFIGAGFYESDKK